MKLQAIKEKIMAIVKKLSKRSITAICAVILIACAVTLNFVLFRNDGDGNTPEKDKSMAINLNNLEDETGEPVISKDDPTDSNYFSTVSLSRQQARDEAMEVLLSVSESSTALADAKEAAANDINQIALDIEKEGDIEAMILAKGFERCVAIVNGDSANVVVQSDTLTPGEIAQISEIVYEAAGINPSNLKIVDKDISE